MADEFLTISETAQKLGCSARTVQRYCKQGLLNHKWVHGKRHRELRVVPPIPLSLIPGVKQGSAVGTENMVSRAEFEEMRLSLTRALDERDRRIGELERGVSGRLSGTGHSAGAADGTRLDRLEAILGEYERVRPVEKKLILKLAQTVSEQGEFLRALGMAKQTDAGED